MNAAKNDCTESGSGECLYSIFYIHMHKNEPKRSNKGDLMSYTLFIGLVNQQQVNV